MLNKVWNEMIYPFPNFNGYTIKVWEWIDDFIPHFIMDVVSYPGEDLNNNKIKFLLDLNGD